VLHAEREVEPFSLLNNSDIFKEKAKHSRYTPWRRLGKRMYSSYSFLTSTLDGGEWSASRPDSAFPGERTSDTHCTGGWVGLRAGLDTEVRGKILFPCRGSNPDRPFLQSVVRHYTDWATRLLFSRKHATNWNLQLPSWAGAKINCV
jgi:hypothetical protein